MPRKKKKPLKQYVMFGFNKDDLDVVGYWKSPNEIVSDKYEATILPSQNNNNKCKDFGTPDQWLKLVNEDPDLNSNFQFHLISILNKTK